MVWFYSRANDALRIETRFEEATNEYVLDVTWPGRPTETERFRDVEAFRARVLVLEARLDAERWKQVGGPQILPHGWRGVITH